MIGLKKINCIAIILIVFITGCGDGPSPTSSSPPSLPDKGSLWGPLTGILDRGFYHIVDTIWVDEWNTLRLESGTVFYFEGPYPFEVRGTLWAESNEDDMIIFTSATAESIRWRGLYLGSQSDNSYFTYCLIENSLAIGDRWDDKNGGGLYCDNSSVNFTNCIFRNDSAYMDGGGIYCIGDSPTFTKCIFIGNSAYNLGGAIACNSRTVFLNCEIIYNSAYRGAAIYCSNNSTLSNCIIYDNFGIESIVHCTDSTTFRNCTIVNNTVTEGATISCISFPINFNSIIIAFNIGAGIYFYASEDSRIEFCNIFDNTVPFEGNPPLGLGELATINANDDSCDAYMNIFSDPLFANRGAGDFHLSHSSRCIGAGDPTNPPPTDMDNNPRPNPPGSNPDIGAYEN